MSQTNQRLNDKQMRWIMEQFDKPINGKVRPLLIALCGSRLHGVHTEKSDYDVYAIHLEQSEVVLSNKPLLETIDVKNEDLNISLQSFELYRALRLATTNNPRFLELLLAPPVYEDEVYAPSMEFARLVIKQSITKNITDAYIGMVKNNLHDYILDTEDVDRQPKRLLGMMSNLLTCCSFVDGQVEIVNFKTLCKKYLTQHEQKIVDTLLFEKQQGKDESGVKDLAIALINSYIEKIKKVRVLSRLPDESHSMDKVHDIVLLTRLYQLKDSDKLQKLITTKKGE